MIKLMKTSLLLTFICVMSVSYGQNAFGGKVGINLGTWNGDTEILGEDIKSNLGIQIGGVFEIAINDLISIQPEFLFLQKGVKSEGTVEFFGEVIETKSNVVFNYLEIPILLKLKFGNQESTNFFITAGPSLGYALNGKLKSEATVGGETEKDSEDIEFEDDDGFNRFDVSAAVGAGVNIPAGPGNLFIEARYLLGLSNLNEDETTDLEIKNGGFGIGVGIMIPMGE